MKIKNLLRTRASRKVEEEVEEELKQKDPETHEGKAILNAPKHNEKTKKNSQKNSS